MDTHTHTIHTEINSCATIHGGGHNCKKNLKVSGDDNEKHVEKCCHKEANQYSRGTWEISASV